MILEQQQINPLAKISLVIFKSHINKDLKAAIDILIEIIAKNTLEIIKKNYIQKLYSNLAYQMYKFCLM